MCNDPAGHYATLGVDAAASAETITAAFRAAARRLHPDVPETGDADAFIRAREAYEVLGDADRREAYDRVAARPATIPEPPPAEADIPADAWQRPAGLSLGLWAGGAVLAMVALGLGLGGLGRPHPEKPLPVAPQPASRPAASPRAASEPPPVTLAAASPGYILPAGVAATLWRRDPSDDRYVPAGALGAFTPVAIRRIVVQHGMVEVRASDGSEGFVYASRLAPGDAAAAERARCIYEAGPPPANNEVLARRRSGSAQLSFENRRDQPAVVKLRDPDGAMVVTVFVAPGGAIVIDHLPAGLHRPEFAFGEMWSRGCRRFVAGMLAQRFARFDRLGETTAPPARYTLPPVDGIDEPDDAFNRD